MIRIEGAREHNLKNIDVEIPHRSLTVVTGVSGSGKSSLAFDILYAEGQRRYVESFSAYARQFLDRMNKPHVERVTGILPAIAIDQRRPVRTSRSTVATMTELHDHLKLLYSKVAKLRCSRCDRPVERDTPESVARRLPEGARLLVCFVVAPPARLPWKEVREGLERAGFTRVLVGGEPAALETLAKKPAERILVVVDRIAVKASARSRLVGSLEQAFHFGKGRASLIFPDDGGREEVASVELECTACELKYRDPTPNLFSFNSPLGACATCRGFGRTIGIDMGLVVPDPRKSIAGGAIRPWSMKATTWERKELLKYCKKHEIATDVPWGDLPSPSRAAILDGDGKGFDGVRGWFRWLETKIYKMHVRIFLSRYRSYDRCNDCGGSRVRSEGLAWRIDGKNVGDVHAMSVGEAHAFFSGVKLGKADEEVAGLVLDEIRARLGFLADVGLEYLTLDRQSRTLSGGELERVDLTTAIGSSLVNTLYILDEPSIGLHPRDSGRLVSILKRLRDNGNTVVVVEHDPEVIREADHVVDLGPGAGEHGGNPRRARRDHRPRGLRPRGARRSGSDRHDPAREPPHLHEGVRPGAEALRGRGSRAPSHLHGVDVLVQRRGRALRIGSGRGLREGRDAVPLRRLRPLPRMPRRALPRRDPRGASARPLGP